MKRYNRLQVITHVNGVGIDAMNGFNAPVATWKRQPEETARMKILWKNLRERRDARTQNRYALRQMAIVASLNINARLECARFFYTLASLTPEAIAARGHPMGREWLRVNLTNREMKR